MTTTTCYRMLVSAGGTLTIHHVPPSETRIEASFILEATPSPLVLSWSETDQLAEDLSQLAEIWNAWDEVDGDNLIDTLAPLVQLWLFENPCGPQATVLLVSGSGRVELTMEHLCELSIAAMCRAQDIAMGAATFFYAFQLGTPIYHLMHKQEYDRCGHVLCGMVPPIAQNGQRSMTNAWMLLPGQGDPTQGEEAHHLCPACLLVWQAQTRTTQMEKEKRTDDIWYHGFPNTISLKRILDAMRRILLRFWHGSPSTMLPTPFDVVQAEKILNVVIRYGTFEEINVVFCTLGVIGYTALPVSNGQRWKLQSIEPIDASSQTHSMQATQGEEGQ